MVWHIDEKVAFSRIPWKEDLATLKGHFECIVILAPEFELPYGIKDLLEMGFRVLHVPIPDLEAPSLDELRAIVNWIQNEVGTGRRVLIACSSGCGRSGTVAVAWLMYSGGLSLREALVTVRRIRHCAVETEGQMTALQKFEHYLKNVEKS
ncbi:dual specificity protein phosphatase family protein [Thermococcus sp. AM4]|uniref:protein-tyrosine phosphatase family protein n=1 Tax=Thermococcus sp. (strain AM4) TaxID=246969 RepID=UPI0001870886|nr:dual specificity protein phosphatase family protein [Thermococcus sp. AM4]EEB74299.1 protein-tyrosine phosphatase [Thermococcus sp. AM4]